MTSKELQPAYDAGKADREAGRRDDRRFGRCSSYFLGWTDADRRLSGPGGGNGNGNGASAPSPSGSAEAEAYWKGVDERLAVHIPTAAELAEEAARREREEAERDASASPSVPVVTSGPGG